MAHPLACFDFSVVCFDLDPTFQKLDSFFPQQFSTKFGNKKIDFNTEIVFGFFSQIIRIDTKTLKREDDENCIRNWGI